LLVQVWTFLGGLFTVTQAKRLYGPIGTGGVLGAIAGSAVARALARSHTPQQLVQAAALGFLATAAVPLFFTGGVEAASEEDGTRPSSIADTARLVARLPYARDFALAMIVATSCVTVCDYVFKSQVAASVPKAQL